MNQDTSDREGGAHKRESHYSCESETTNKSRKSEERVPLTNVTVLPMIYSGLFFSPPSINGLNAVPVMASFLHII